MNPDEFVLKFRGVRGGYPMPGPTTIRYGGNTTCFEIRVGGHLVIVDAGFGIISLGQEMLAQHYTTGEPILATLLFTHLHHDHTQGMPFFAPFLDPHATLYIFGPRPSETTTLEEELVRAIQSPLFPIGLEELYSQRHISHIRGRDTLVLRNVGEPPQLLTAHDDARGIPPDAVVIHVHHGYHHPRSGVLIFRINYGGRSLVIATDTEGYIGGDRRLIKFARNADLLIHDAEYDEHEYADESINRQGWGHSTWRMAIEVAQAAQVKRLALFHHKPTHDDDYLDEIEHKAQAIFPQAFMAQEGMTVSL